MILMPDWAVWQIEIVYRGKPVPKPRMTQRDKDGWKQKPAVKRYFEFKETFGWMLKEAGFRFDSERVCEVHLKIFFPLPKKLSKKMKAQGIKSIEELKGQFHRFLPGADADNVLKAICDSAASDDMAIYRKSVVKYWDDGAGSRVEVRLIIEEHDYSLEVLS